MVVAMASAFRPRLTNEPPVPSHSSLALAACATQEFRYARYQHGRNAEVGGAGAAGLAGPMVNMRVNMQSMRRTTVCARNLAGHHASHSLSSVVCWPCFGAVVAVAGRRGGATPTVLQANPQHRGETDDCRRYCAVSLRPPRDTAAKKDNQVERQLADAGSNSTC
jgi:hypothetical protein